MNDTWTTLGSGDDNDESSAQQQNYQLATILIGVMCVFGIFTNIVVVYRVVATYIKAKENIHAADMYVFHKAIFDLLLLMSCPCYVISVWNGRELNLLPWQCRILVSTDFLAILLSNHVIIGLVFERYGRRIEKNGKPLIVSRADTIKHFQANVLYCLMLAVPIVFVGDEIVWRRIPSCGYNWPIGQNYHAVIYASLFGVVYCISYFLFSYWGLDLLKQKLLGVRQPIVLPENERRRDKVAGLFLLINFCCWTPFWCYHIYIMIHYYRVKPTIHIPGGFHPDEIVVSALVYLSASINIIPCALLIKDWAPQYWLKTLNVQSNVTVLQDNPAVRLNQNGVSGLSRNRHETLPDHRSSHHDNLAFDSGIKMSKQIHMPSRVKGIGKDMGNGKTQGMPSTSVSSMLGVPSTSY